MEVGTGEEDRKRVVVVMGSTGVGKTQLAIDLALGVRQRGVRAEVINADSMQIYRGFPVATAKVTEEETEGVVHHLLDVVEPTDVSFNVVQYCRLALDTIADIHKRGGLPIIVGGTHYYLEALLWDNVLLHALDAPLVPKSLHRLARGSEGDAVGCTDGEEVSELYAQLSRVDPKMAAWIHPHNERKIRRALEVFNATGVPYSKLLQHQAAPRPRFDALLFWIECDRSVLNSRLDGRVDKMIQAGLLDEVAELRRLYQREGLPMDYTKGILQAIGYKEFAPYFAALRDSSSGDDGEQENAALRSCVEALKQRTRKYAKVQTRWIERHFRPRTTIHRVYSTRAERKEKWVEEVRLPALQTLRHWLESGDRKRNANTEAPATQFVEVLRPPPSASDVAAPDVPNGKREREQEQEPEGEDLRRAEALDARWRRFECEECGGKVLQGEAQWQAHLKSRGHRHHRKRRRRQQEQGESTNVLLPSLPGSDAEE